MARSFGTGRSLVSDEPPNAVRSTSSSTCFSTFNARATLRAASISCACRCPYLTVSANSRNPSSRAIAAAVYESSPPLSSTTAGTRDSGFGIRNGLNASRVRIPDVLMKLELNPDRKIIGEDPLRDQARIHDPVNRGEMNRGRPMREIMPADHVARVLVVLAILDDELHFVVRPQSIEV